MGASSSKIIVYEHFNCLIFMDLDADLLGCLVVARIKYDFFVSARGLAAVYRLSYHRTSWPTTGLRVPFRTLNQG